MLENLGSILRAVLIAVGSFVIGHKYFGGTISNDLWASFTGGVLVVGSTIWGIVTKSATIESIQSGLRSFLTFGFAFLLAKGVVTAEQITIILSSVGTIVPLIYSIYSKQKTQAVAAGKLSLSQLAGVKKAAMILIIMCISGAAMSQQIQHSFFSPIKAKSSVQSVRRFGATVTATDSTFSAFRPIVIAAAYSLPDNHLMAGAGISWQNLTYNYATQRTYCNYSISAVGFAGGNVAPTTQSQVVSYGIMVGALNNLIMVGAILNSGKVQAALSIGINLNN